METLNILFISFPSKIASLPALSQWKQALQKLSPPLVQSALAAFRTAPSKGVEPQDELCNLLVTNARKILLESSKECLQKGTRNVNPLHPLS